MTRLGPNGSGMPRLALPRSKARRGLRRKSRLEHVIAELGISQRLFWEAWGTGGIRRQCVTFPIDQPGSVLALVFGRVIHIRDEGEVPAPFGESDDAGSAPFVDVVRYLSSRDVL